MIVFIPKVHCAKCNAVPYTIQRRQDGTNRFIVVKCHGEEAQIPFAQSPDEQVTLWQPDQSAQSPHSN